MEKKTVYNITNSIAISEEETVDSNIPEVNKAEINLSQLKRNFDIIQGFLKPNTKFMAVLKGDAYGHGILPIAKELMNLKCDAFGVVRLVEAFTIRKAGIKTPIMLLAPISPSQAAWVIRYNIIPMVDSKEIVEALNQSASQNDTIVKLHVKINTGLNRYGVNPENAVKFIREIHEKYLHVQVDGVYTHFQDPDYNPDFTYKQIECFNNIIFQLQKQKLRPRIIHAANSTGIIRYPEAHYDMVRCGTLLFGLEHEQGQRNMPKGIKALMELKGRIMKVRTIKAGEAGGYGSTFIAKKDSKVAIIAFGYGDGISRGWKEVLVAGKRVPVVNYFMDGLMVDISSLDETVSELDEAVIIGSQGNESITWLEACKSLGSYVDEQIQYITERVPKKYFYEK
ncbi:alanine racemase [Clostridium acetobutylicum]|nr:alanine racemase [Clostridium acetobutylicum]